MPGVNSFPARPGTAPQQAQVPAAPLKFFAKKLLHVSRKGKALSFPGSREQS